MKQLEIAAHSSGRSGGDRRVFDVPAAGVLHTMAMAMRVIGHKPRDLRLEACEKEWCQGRSLAAYLSY